MKYIEAVDAFFTPSPDGAIAAPTTRTDASRRLRDAIEPIAMHSVWSPDVNAVLEEEFGLNFITGYAWSRAAALGEPSPGVAVAAFGVFEPGLVRASLEQGRALVGRDELLAVRQQATIESLSKILAKQDIEFAATALRDAAKAADGTGRPLYSGLADMEWPQDPVGMLWHSAEMLREHRGDAHVAVCTAHGLLPVEMNILTELYVGMPLGTYTGSRGWPPERIEETATRMREEGLLDGDVLSIAGQSLREEIEVSTDALGAPHVNGLLDDLEFLLAELDIWSGMCIDAGAFPPDVFKRAAG